MTEDELKIIFLSDYSASQHQVCLLTLADATTTCYYPTTSYQSQLGGVYLGGNKYVANFAVTNDGFVLKEIDLTTGASAWSFHLQWTTASTYKYSPLAKGVDDLFMMAAIVTVNSEIQLICTTFNKTNGAFLRDPVYYLNDTTDKDITGLSSHENTAWISLKAGSENSIVQYSISRGKFHTHVAGPGTQMVVHRYFNNDTRYFYR